MSAHRGHGPHRRALPDPPSTTEGPWPPSRIDIAWTLAATLLCWVLVSCLTVPHLPAADAPTRWVGYAMYDYRDTVWLPIRDLLHGGQPWDGAAYAQRHPQAQIFPLYLVHYWLVAWPLALLPWRASVVLWLGVMSACYAALVHLSVAAFWRRTMLKRPWLVAALMLVGWSFRPVRTVFSLGQLALPCAVGTTIALLAHRRTRASVLGTTLALVKPPVGLALILAQVSTRRTRTSIAGVLAAGLGMVPVLATMAILDRGPRRLVHQMWLTLRAGEGGGPGINTHTDVASTLSRLGMPSTPALLFDLLVAAALLLTARRRTAQEGDTTVWTLTTACLVLVLITPNILYCTLALFPAMSALAAHLAGSDRQRGRAAFILLLLVAVQWNTGRLWTLVHLPATFAEPSNGILLLLAALVCMACPMSAEPARRYRPTRAQS